MNAEGFKYVIYIGLKDKQDYEEYFSIETFRDVLSRYCEKEQIAFSLISQYGGYAHGLGYTTETSLKIELIGASLEMTKQMALTLKEYVNTDTVMITREPISVEYI